MRTESAGGIDFRAGIDDRRGFAQRDDERAYVVVVVLFGVMAPLDAVPKA